jgi:EmrB/QacA subfamily drug resistance transporter
VTNLALPDIADDFSTGVASTSWVVTSYAILFAAVLAPAGALADVLGRRRLFLLGLATFTGASAVVAAAPSYEVLLAGRAVQGLGAALLVPASLALVLAESAPERRAAAIGLWSASGAFAAAAGPVLGGIAVDTLGWRSLFCLNLPIGLWLLLRGRDLSLVQPTGSVTPDLLGAGFLALAVGGLVYGLTEGQGRGWSDGLVVGGFVLAVAAGMLTLVRATAHPRPALELSLLRSPTYAAATAVSLLYGAALYASLLLGVLFLVGVWGYSELEAGLAMTPGALAASVVALSLGRLPRRPSPRGLVLFGSAVMAVDAAALALWLPEEPNFLGFWLPAGVAIGIGMGAATVGVSSAAALSAPPQSFASATGLAMAARQVGGALGIAMLAALLEGLAGPDVVRPFAAVYWAMAALATGAAVAGLLIRVANPVVAPASEQVGAR